jgi:integrase
MSGHIRRRGERSWELKFDLGTNPVTGKRLTRYQSFRGTKREARHKLTELLDQANKGTFIRSSKETLGDYLARWVRDWVAINVSRKTGERYDELIRLHVRPQLGAIVLQDLRPSHLAELYARLLREGRRDCQGLAPRTVRQIHAVLHKALAIAVDWDLVANNIVDRVKPPHIAASEIEILTERQIGQVLAKLRDEPLYPIVALALATGLRRGEALALRWCDIDLDRAKLRVECSIEQTKTGTRLKAPKTVHGRRIVSLAPWIVGDLRAHRKAQLEQRLRLGQGQLADDALLFPTLEGTPRNPDKFSKEWARAAARLGLPGVTFHALRHTHASQLIAAVMDVLTISRRLGHGSPTITLGVYGHLFSNTDDQAAQIMERAFGRVTGAE